MKPSAGSATVLLIGPLPTPDEVIGGSKVAFAETVRNLESSFDVLVLNTTRQRANLSSWRRLASDFAALMRTIRGVLIHLKNVQVAVLNMSLFGVWFVVPCLSICCRMAGVPLVLRFFGNGHRFYRFGPIARWLTAKVVLGRPLVYVQTRRLQKHLNAPNVRWLPNARNVMPCHPNTRRNTQHKVANMVFIGQLRMAKGFREALDACQGLPPDCHLTVFGPCMRDTDMSLFHEHPRATYGGVLRPDEVPDTLAEHDLLLFPSYWESEGYPGIIVESFQTGMPVVATRWNEIPELVEDGYNGLLVEPRSTDALRAAVERLRSDPHLYQRLCEGAHCTGERFRSPVWYRKMALDLRKLVETGHS